MRKVLKVKSRSRRKKGKARACSKRSLSKERREKKVSVPYNTCSKRKIPMMNSTKTKFMAMLFPNTSQLMMNKCFLGPP